MEPYILGTIRGYRPEMHVNLFDDMLDIRVRGIPDRIAKLPRNTREAIVTSDGMLFYSTCNRSIHMVIPDQPQRVADIVNEHDRVRRASVAAEEQMKARGARLIESQPKAVAAVQPVQIKAVKPPEPYIEVKDETLFRMLDGYEKLTEHLRTQLRALLKESAGIKDELSTIQRELDILKSKAAQHPHCDATEAIVALPERRSLHDGLVVVSDNPFVRRR